VLIDLLLWPLIAIPAVLIGLRLMPLIGLAGAFRRPVDGTFFALWLGLLVIADLLFAAALLGPLTPSLIVALAVALSIVALAHADVRVQALGAIRALTVNGRRLAVIAALAVAAALVASQPIYWEDSGLYHIQAIKWLASTGTVPGVALIHGRFGFVSSWFAIPAALNHGILAGRTGALLNGFALFTMASFLFVTLRRWWFGRYDRADIVFAAAATIVLLFCMQYGIANSPSPDLPIAVLTILAAWSYLAIRDDANPIAPFVLMLGAVTVKLSAAALLIAAAALVFFKLDLKQKIYLAAGAAVALAPVVAHSLLATGCLLFPLPMSCADPDWSVGAEVARSTMQGIAEFGHWGPTVPPDATAWNWIPSWPLRRMSNMMFSGLLLLSLALAVVKRRSILSHPGSSYAAILAFAGIAYVLASAPDLRFVVGALAIVPALWLAELADAGQSRRPSPGLVVATVVAAFVVAAGVNTIRLAREPIKSGLEPDVRVAPRLMLPSLAARLGTPVAPDPAFSQAEIMQGFAARRTGDVAYNIPVPIGLCWDVPLPCATETLDVILRLRDPARGLAAGFSRAR